MHPNPATVTEQVDWSAYRACSQVCRAPIGQPCVSLSSKVVDGRPDGVRIELDQPHKARKPRTRRRRKTE